MVKNRRVKLLLEKIIKELEDLKAFEIQSLNIKNRSALADFIIIASGNSSRHVNSIVTNLIKNNKNKILSSEGLGKTDWVIVDFGDIIVNVFKPETRKYYSIEKIWTDNELKDEKISFG
ncbi:MAG: ribosome silencing factor [Rickettsiales bacterium]|jgi:ribosome-associated protein|nr:ribosome silencing factor [Rickettsiales bacterium]OUT43331.1 MAG: ribosome silencing factor [Pelagibacteraceae bacterium TMED13]|tara:strand:- start:20369 stop:20725 length:357 start_codon:yes stop_codon:yes gene_type:complete